MLTKIRKAQSTLEYALLIGVIVGAFLAMQNYLKRSLQGRMQIIGDQMGDQYSPGLTKRTEQMLVHHESIIEEMQSGASHSPRESLAQPGPTTSTTITGGRQEMNAYRSVKPLEQETWPE